MNKTILGIPLVLVIFILAILAPILGSNYMIYQAVKGNVVPTPTVAVMSVAPTASPSATIAPTVTKKFTPVKTTVTVVPTVTK